MGAICVHFAQPPTVYMVDQGIREHVSRGVANARAEFA
jgi:hypothetical protein